MTRNRKALALSFGLASVVSAATFAQAPKAAQTLVVEDATVDWIQRSDVSALRPGVIDKMELHIGQEAGVYPNNIIGYLHRESANLAVEEARVAAETKGALAKAEAQKFNAGAVVARSRRLKIKDVNLVSAEDMQKAEAEFAMADAMVTEANENLALAKAKLKSAEQTAEEHIIRAPFPGVIFEEIKHEGESVNSNEAVVRLGNLDKLRVWAYIPIEYRQRVTEGSDVEIQPRLGDGRSGVNPLEQKRFKGKISFVDPKVQPVSGSEVRIYADVDNQSHELGPGMKTTMIITLKPESTAYAAPAGRRAPATASPTLEPAAPTSLGANGLPPLPR
ncbi:efflux RND transporter periplasmic adaptor subunit [Tundrisphaera sp. TA3]|uniref:efflux RND transporter periplasmic adaptor subunit n=1 Tax=Tundrisphaera sp. TA3 TaxID=3435775 RepID=UPI003EC0CF0D